ncbi:unnamed protein product [Miscanthus lutarioriparius]|uniref:GAG-pre-integrase domain-containing protein n=1 Tax=Miscanthus lutarioriparius TaxID=422564 RepID=A0A811Q8Z4_9POAL|nr:unnamed protein product [Miscanthus lutarioriparius]
MASMKFDLPLLDYKTRFALCQVKMRTILAQSSDLDEALDGFGGKRAKEKTATKFWLKLESICMSKDLTSKMHVMIKLFTHKLQEGSSLMNHLSIFKEIVADLVSMRDWFSSYKSVQSGDVMRMGDNNPREIMGIGSVQIKMHDGMIRTLKDVRHIPGMARNLISLSTLDAEGFRHSGSGGHMRLGHMSELGMAELIKRDLLDGCTVGKMKFCEHCIFGKHKSVKFNASVHTTKVKGYKLWNAETKMAFISRNVVFNESVMFNDSLSTDVSPVDSDEEQEHISVQPQNQSIADRRTKRSCGPCPRLIEECDIIHYAFSCAEQVENIHEPATYTEAVVSGDREKWISAM